MVGPVSLQKLCKVQFFQRSKSSNFVMNMDRALTFLGMCFLYHVDGDSAFTSFICEIVSSLHVHENDEIYILNL